jgi:ATP-dependent DNA helicase RecQ
VPVGSGYLSVHEFDLERFQKNFYFPGRALVGGLKRLEEAGYLVLSDSFKSPSRVKIAMASQDLYEYQVMHATMEPLIKTLLRIYGGGLFSEYIPVREEQVAYYLGADSRQVVNQLQFLHKHGVLEYLPARDKPHITFLTERYDPQDLPLAKFNFEARKQLDMERAGAMIRFAKLQEGCRMQFVSGYFGQEVSRCGVCDNCLKEAKKPRPVSPEELRAIVLEALAAPATSSELAARLALYDKKAVLDTARQLLAENVLEKDSDNRVYVKK